MISQPTVSIVVLCYNHAAFIDECIQSCVEQEKDHPSLEIVVADDGSSDGTPNKIQRWASRFPELIVPVLAPRNTGIPENFNRGLAAARGDYIAWLGGDDILLSGKIARQHLLITANPHASGVYHDAEVFSWPSGAVLGTFSKLYAGKAATADYIDSTRMIDPRYQMLPSTVMARKQAMPNAFDTRLRFHNDFLFDFESIVKGGPYLRMNGVYTRYRKHEKSIGMSPTTRAMMLEENLMAISIMEARYPQFAKLLAKRAVYYLTLEYLKCRASGDHERARQLTKLLCSRGARFRGYSLALFGDQLTFLLEPRFRELAIRIRSLLG